MFAKYPTSKTSLSANVSYHIHETIAGLKYSNQWIIIFARNCMRRYFSRNYINSHINLAFGVHFKQKEKYTNFWFFAIVATTSNHIILCDRCRCVYMARICRRMQTKGVIVWHNCQLQHDFNFIILRNERINFFFAASQAHYFFFVSGDGEPFKVTSVC